VKSAVNFIGKYEEQLQRLAVKRQCDGIIAGHVHHPADTMVGKVRYLNCGDWVETMSAVLEYGDGRMETVLYKDFMKRLAYGKCGTMEDAETSPGTGDS
jgi:glycosyltransferase, family 1